MVWMGFLRCEKLWRSIARTFALMAPVRPDLHRVSRSNEMFPNAPKHSQMHQNMSLGFNDMDRVPSLRKILTRLRCTNFCTSLARFAPTFVRQPNGPECTKIVRNAPKRQFRVQWGGSGAFVVKNSDVTSWHELLHLVGLFCIEFRKATKRYRMHQNSMKRTKMSV